MKCRVLYIRKVFTIMLLVKALFLKCLLLTEENLINVLLNKLNLNRGDV